MTSTLRLIDLKSTLFPNADQYFALLFHRAGYQKKKKIVIHVPIHKKIEKHIHTVVKHVHHHHKPLVLKEEKKVIHEDHRPIQIHQTKEHIHHHSLPLPAAAASVAVAPPEPELEEEEEHIHHHHNYEHRGRLRDDFIEGEGSSSEER